MEMATKKADQFSHPSPGKACTYCDFLIIDSGSEYRHGEASLITIWLRPKDGRPMKSGKVPCAGRHSSECGHLPYIDFQTRPLQPGSVASWGHESVLGVEAEEIDVGDLLGPSFSAIGLVPFSSGPVVCHEIQVIIENRQLVWLGGCGPVIDVFYQACSGLCTVGFPQLSSGVAIVRGEIKLIVKYCHVGIYRAYGALFTLTDVLD